MNIYIYGNNDFVRNVKIILEKSKTEDKIDNNSNIILINALDDLKKAIQTNPDDIYLIDEDRIIKKNSINSKIKFLTPKDSIEEDFLLNNGIADIALESLEEVPKYIEDKIEENNLKKTENIQESIIDIVDNAYKEDSEENNTEKENLKNNEETKDVFEDEDLGSLLVKDNTPTEEIDISSELNSKIKNIEDNTNNEELNAKINNFNKKLINGNRSNLNKGSVGVVGKSKSVKEDSLKDIALDDKDKLADDNIDLGKEINFNDMDDELIQENYHDEEVLKDLFELEGIDKDAENINIDKNGDDEKETMNKDDLKQLGIAFPDDENEDLDEDGIPDGEMPEQFQDIKNKEKINVSDEQDDEALEELLSKIAPSKKDPDVQDHFDKKEDKNNEKQLIEDIANNQLENNEQEEKNIDVNDLLKTISTNEQNIIQDVEKNNQNKKKNKEVQMSEFSQLDNLKEEDLLKAINDTDVEVKHEKKSLDTMSSKEIVNVISELLKNKTLEITIKVKD